MDLPSDITEFNFQKPAHSDSPGTMGRLIQPEDRLNLNEPTAIHKKEIVIHEIWNGFQHVSMIYLFFGLIFYRTLLHSRDGDDRQPPPVPARKASEMIRRLHQLPQ